MLHRNSRLLTAAVTAGVLAAGCSAQGSPTDTADGASPSATPASELVVQVASYDLATGGPSRVIVGLLTPDNELITGGEVELEFFRLDEDSAEAVAGPTTTGEFLPVPGKEPASPADQPTPGSPSDGVGVYQGTVTFDEPGQWSVQVTADLAGTGTVTSSSGFEVNAEHQVPVVGDQAISVINPTIDADIPDVAIDSRAATGDGGIPDPELHQQTITDMLDQGRPMLLVFSTPVYCVSQFCGPVTDEVAELAAEYSDRAAFIHVEVWGDYEQSLGNQAAQEWLLEPNGDFQEPWIFLVDADGTIVGRWDNVPDGAQIEAMLQDLPVLDQEDAA